MSFQVCILVVPDRTRYHALRGNVFFDALRYGGTTDYIAAKKIFVSIAFPGTGGRKASEERTHAKRGHENIKNSKKWIWRLRYSYSLPRFAW